MYPPNFKETKRREEDGYSFQKTPHKSHFCSSCDDALDESLCESKIFPSLPIFGSVSAASPIENKVTTSEENAVPYVPSTTNRVSQYFISIVTNKLVARSVLDLIL
uniref:Uncharacterized protein n=1 Tax=Timema monikensis TaxID=170555 RepID=A0A7R9HS70_9NEOP|nr:unnamed protein product [Timema monikensis]